MDRRKKQCMEDVSMYNYVLKNVFTFKQSLKNKNANL